jgi:hypothetical protein
MHEKKVKGDIGVVHVVAALTEQQWNVGILITEHSKYDLLAEKDGRVVRVQVKYTAFKKDKKRIEVKLASSWADRNGNHRRLREVGDYDVLAIYCPDTKECYFIKEEVLKSNVRSFTLSFEPERKVARLAKDFVAL